MKVKSILIIITLMFLVGYLGFTWAGESKGECKCKSTFEAGEGSEVNKLWDALFGEFAGMQVAKTPDEKLKRIERFLEIAKILSVNKTVTPVP